MKKWFSIIVLLMAMVLAACGNGKDKNESSQAASKDGKPEQTKVELVGVRDAQISSQQIIAEKKGYFKEEGLDVTNKLIESGPDIAPLVSGGSAPMSLQTNFMDIILASNGIGVKIVAPLAQIAGTQAVVAGKNSGIKSAKDLEGKTLGVPSGADVQIAIKQMAKEYHVNMDKVKIANLAPSDALASLQNGSIDAMAAWEPFITKAISAGGTLLFSGTKNYLEGKEKDVNWMSVHTTFQVTDDYLKQNPNTVKAVLRALEKATVFINEHRDEAIKILAPELHLSESELKEIMNRNVYDMTADDSFINNSNGKTVTNYLMDTGNIKKVPAQSDYIDLSYLKEVNKDLVKADIKK